MYLWVQCWVSVHAGGGTEREGQEGVVYGDL